MSLVAVERPRPHVAVVRLDHPDHLNSMSFDLVGDFYASLNEVGDDNDVWVVVLTGAGRSFCSGLELEDFGDIPGSDGLGLARLGMKAISFMSGVVPAMRALPQPVIAAVNGPAFGGGMCMTLGADIRLADETAVFCGAGVVNGLTAAELGATFLLPRLIGASRSAELLLTGRRLDADEAERIGLVSRVLPAGEVVEAALDMADDMCRLSPFGIMMTKEVLWANLEAGSLTAAIDLENRTQLLAGHTGNLDEARAAFREGRPPVFTE
ncbi:MAG: enoyl-CoA hydratase-related protein [Acidimicrobiia bacterium]|nr:enoyl-CoA hydratase-related protein [Acidimicrobiia bacterium]